MWGTVNGSKLEKGVAEVDFEAGGNHGEVQRPRYRQTSLPRNQPHMQHQFFSERFNPPSSAKITCRLRSGFGFPESPAQHLER